MRIQVNLASEPFRRDRPMIVASAVVAGLLVISFGILTWIILADRGNMQQTRADLADAQKRLARVEAQQRKLDAALRQPGNAQVLERSIFLNAIIQRKGISWTRIFEDLEKCLPHDVRIMAIRPQINPQNQIYLDMTVAATSQQPVINFLIKLESSDVFGATTVSAVLPPSQTEPMFRFRINVNYQQKL